MANLVTLYQKIDKIDDFSYLLRIGKINPLATPTEWTSSQVYNCQWATVDISQDQ